MPNHIAMDISGENLIVRFIRVDWTKYTFCTVVDLSGRQPDKTISFGGLIGGTILEIELYDNYLVFAYPLDMSITRVSAVRFNETASEGRARVTVDTPHVEFTKPYGGRVIFGRALHHASHPLVIPVWSHEYGLSHAERISRFDITVNEDQDGGVCPAFVRQEGKSILSRGRLQNGEDVPSSTPSPSSSGPRDMPIVDVPTPNTTTVASRTGHSRLLRVLAAKDSECGTFFLTDMCDNSRANDDSGAETRIAHRPLFVLNDQNTLDLFTQPKGIQSHHIAFNELSGRIAVPTCDPGVYSITVYEV